MTYSADKCSYNKHFKKILFNYECNGLLELLAHISRDSLVSGTGETCPAREEK